MFAFYYSQVTYQSDVRYIVLDLLIDQEGYSEVRRGEERWGGVEMFNLCSINVQFMLSLYLSVQYENSNYHIGLQLVISL